MKTLTKLIALSTLTLITTIYGCKKDDSSTSESKTQSLTGGNKRGWVLSGFKQSGNDRYSQLFACQKSEVRSYSTDKSFSLDSCGSGKISRTGTWKFNSDESLLIASYHSQQDTVNYRDTLKIVSISSSKLVVNTFSRGQANTNSEWTYSAK